MYVEFNWCSLYFLHFILNIIFVPMSQVESRSINIVVVVVLFVVFVYLVSFFSSIFIIYPSDLFSYKKIDTKLPCLKIPSM